MNKLKSFGSLEFNKISQNTELKYYGSDKVDREFNEIYFKEILPLISKSFLILSAETCDNQLRGNTGGLLEVITKEKANQVKEKINSYIDLQVEQNIKIFRD